MAVTFERGVASRLPLRDPLVELVARRLQVLGQPRPLRLVDELGSNACPCCQAVVDQKAWFLP